MASLRINSLLLVYLTYTLSVYADDECVVTRTCLCIFPNGTGIDLSPAVSPTFYTAQLTEEKNDSKEIEVNQFYYHPCYDEKLAVSVPSYLPANLTSNTCSDPLQLCNHVVRLKNDKEGVYNVTRFAYDYLGKSTIATLQGHGTSVKYTNGPSNTTVFLRCSQSENKLEVISIAEPNDLQLAFYSKDACLKLINPHTGRSVGSTLLIIFFSFLIFYLVLGICTKKFLMGATGIEVIPNLGFWSDLPNLVKDGWLFMSNGFKLPARASGHTVSPDPNSYDSI